MPTLCCIVQVSALHGQPFTLNHWRMKGCTYETALEKVRLNLDSHSLSAIGSGRDAHLQLH
jgi:hypothetical protein